MIAYIVLTFAISWILWLASSLTSPAGLYSNTRGSLLPVMLLHAAVINTKDIVPSADPDSTSPWVLSHLPVTCHGPS